MQDDREHPTAQPLLALYERVINENNIDAMEDIYVPTGYVNHAAPFGLAKDLPGVRRLFQMFIDAFPDQHIVAEHVIVDGQYVVARWTLTGTHTGEFMGHPPTGRPFEMTGIDIERIVDGRIAEHWGGEDMLGLLLQLGAQIVPGQPESTN